MPWTTTLILIFLGLAVAFSLTVAWALIHSLEVGRRMDRQAGRRTR